MNCPNSRSSCPGGKTPPMQRQKLHNVQNTLHRHTSVFPFSLSYHSSLGLRRIEPRISFLKRLDLSSILLEDRKPVTDLDPLTSLRVFSPRPHSSGSIRCQPLRCRVGLCSRRSRQALCSNPTWRAATTRATCSTTTSHPTVLLVLAENSSPSTQELCRRNVRSGMTGCFAGLGRRLQALLLLGRCFLHWIRSDRAWSAWYDRALTWGGLSSFTSPSLLQPLLLQIALSDSIRSKNCSYLALETCTLRARIWNVVCCR